MIMMTAILLIHPQEAESFGFMIHRINVTDIEVRAKELKQTIMDLPTARNDTVIVTKFEQIFDMIDVMKSHRRERRGLINAIGIMNEK